MKAPHKHKGINPTEISVVQLHQYLLAGVAPRPIALVSTIDSEGNINLSPFSYFNVFGANPPLLIFSPARRVRNNTIKHSLENVRDVKEVVINMVDHAMVEQMSLSSCEYDKGINEFEKAGFIEKKSTKVKPPRVAASPVAFECLVKEVIESGSQGGAGNLVICEIVFMHFRKDILDAEEMPDTLNLNLVGRMGGSWYVKTNSENMFEIPKPLKTNGIGVDSLPFSARNSTILTGNNLGRLGNAASLPSGKEIEEMERLLNEEGSINWKEEGFLDECHKLVVGFLNKNEIEKAIALLLFQGDKFAGYSE